MRVFVDTNAWLRCAALRIDIWEEAKRMVPGTAQIVTIDRVIRELDGIKAAGGTLAREAKLALELIRHKTTPILAGRPDGSTDDALVAAANEPDFVLTQDAELKRKLKAKQVGVMIIRQDNHLALENR